MVDGEQVNFKELENHFPGLFVEQESNRILEIISEFITQLRVDLENSFSDENFNSAYIAFQMKNIFQAILESPDYYDQRGYVLLISKDEQSGELAGLTLLALGTDKNTEAHIVPSLKKKKTIRRIQTYSVVRVAHQKHGHATKMQMALGLTLKSLGMTEIFANLTPDSEAVFKRHLHKNMITSFERVKESSKEDKAENENENNEATFYIRF